MKDVECPYCGAELEIDHGDGDYGRDEERIYQQECTKCWKTFTYTTSISFYYETAKADCLNGGEHNFKPVFHSPVRWPDWKRCVDCEYEDRGEYKEQKTNDQT